eukprot:CAMPEP_0205928414 /NCGR_PEP_ID=MMETSP1325-20131115/24699_1 /ASSEMBLY_ACC=CAM_ASM_000708 /TAXON_ID=236786 /ORGANISM="Florenciella sp., Strain RCC1007" /LENGTH=388 /DNA_ID=CAMNT_0053297443 /DNA_START=75 /DNA_END=1241 /DNA_ORIENTATION=+
MAEFLEQQALLHPDQAEEYNKLLALFNRRLWHQLTSSLAEFLSNVSNRRGDNFIQLYQQFLVKFEGKLNQLEFAKLVNYVALSHDDPEAAIAFYNAMLEKRMRLGADATLYLELLLWLYKLTSSAAEEDRAKTLGDVKQMIESKRPELDALEGVMDTCVHSTYYQLATEYFKEAGPHESYYKHALMLLAYTPMDSMSPEQATALATDMSLAAISGDSVYNFGEVLATPIVGALVGTPNEWLGELLRCFNRGDIEQFNMLVDTYSNEYFAQPALKLRHSFIKEKLALLSLVNFLFETPSHDRNIPFAAIADRTRLPLDQVEWLAMRAMSLELIKGSMDEVEQILHVDWVQPRVLDNDQMSHLAERLGEWSEKVTNASHFITDQTPELLG